MSFILFFLLLFSVSYFFKRNLMIQGASQAAQLVKNPLVKGVDTRYTGLTLGSGRSPEGRNGNPFHLQRSLEGYSL